MILILAILIYYLYSNFLTHKNCNKIFYKIEKFAKKNHATRSKLNEII